MPIRLSVQQKYRLCQMVFGLGFVATLYWLKRMGPFESPHHNKMMFAMAMATVLMAIPFGLGFYYYRSKLHDIDTGLAGVGALAHAGEKQPQQPQANDAQEDKHL